MDGTGSDGGDGGGSSDGGGGIDGGGSSDGGTVEINKSGSRIKMKVLNSPDGAKVFQNSYDSQRNEDCTFQLASDGMTRCLPSSVTFSGFFADAGCTVPAGYYWAGCTPPTYISAPPPTATCALVTTVGPAIYATGSAITTYYQKAGVTCTETTLSTVFTVYTSTGAAIPASSFQSATIASE